MRPRYVITRRPGNIAGGTTERWRVRETTQEDWAAAEVWWYPEGQTARCCVCSTALIGMSSTCTHARALRRKLVKK